MAASVRITHLQSEKGLQVGPRKKPAIVSIAGFFYLLGWLMGLEPNRQKVVDFITNQSLAA